MKKLFFFLSLLSFSSLTFAFDARFLVISVTNDTAEECVLQNSVVTQGFLYQGMVPSSLSSGEKEIFYMQGFECAIHLRLSYLCGAQALTFDSEQEKCNFTAGDVKGIVFNDSTLQLEYQKKGGSLWVEMRPGEIHWRIY